MFIGYEIRSEGRAAQRLVEMTIEHWVQKVSEMLVYPVPALEPFEMKSTKHGGGWHVHGRCVWVSQVYDEHFRQLDGRRIWVHFDFEGISLDTLHGDPIKAKCPRADIKIPHMDDPKGNPGNILARAEIGRDRLGAPWDVMTFFPREESWHSRLGQHIHGKGPNSKPPIPWGASD